jgi:hypothetical protein
MSSQPLGQGHRAVARRAVLVVILAVAMSTLAALPVSGYGHANTYHLRLSRLDPISCGRWIDLRADLSDNRGRPVKDKTVYFEIKVGAPGDVLSPRSATTNRWGQAGTRVKLDCSRGVHKVWASVPNKASAGIVLTTTGAQWPNPPWAGLSHWLSFDWWGGFWWGRPGYP